MPNPNHKSPLPAPGKLDQWISIYSNRLDTDIREAIETGQPLSMNQVARIQGKSMDWLYKNWKKMVRDFDFPEPIHQVGIKQWDGLAVIMWKISQNPHIRLAHPDQDNETQITGPAQIDLITDADMLAKKLNARAEKLAAN